MYTTLPSSDELRHFNIFLENSGAISVDGVSVGMVATNIHAHDRHKTMASDRDFRYMGIQREVVSWRIK
jgi:hypothetical protein